MQPKNNNCLLSLRKAGVFKDRRWLVRDIDLELYRGEIVTLIGPNGSGKSTTAKMALGIVEPTSGKIWRQDGMRVGYIPQKLTIDASLPLTVRRLMTLSAPMDKQSLHMALNETGVADLATANVADLSGGELQRVLLARAIARKPDFLVLDEPLQGVDFNGERDLYTLIGTLRKKLNCAILLISHDLHIVMAETDRVLCLNGHICCSGTPADIVSSEVYSKLMGGTIAEGLAIYQHHHDHHHGPNGEVMSMNDTHHAYNHAHNHNHEGKNNA